MNDVKISIIVPNYNKEKYLKECLDSVQQQTFKNFECIIVDDGSTDNSKDIIQEFCKDIRFHAFYNQNHGLAYSRNFGIRNAKGKFILPLDSDDYIALDYVERAINFFKELPDFSLFYGKWKFIGHNAEIMNAKLGGLHYQSYNMLLKSNSIHCSCIYKKEDAIRCGLYDESMKAYEDWEFLIRLLHNNHKVCYSPIESLYYRQFEQSMSSYGHQHYSEIYNYIMQKNIDIFKKYHK